MYPYVHRYIVMGLVLLIFLSLFYLDTLVVENISTPHLVNVSISFVSEFLSSIEVYLFFTLIVYLVCRVLIPFLQEDSSSKNWMEKIQRHAKIGFFGFLLTALIVLSLKVVVGRARPFIYIDNFESPLRPFSYTWEFHSFPSGNAATMGAIAVLLLLFFSQKNNLQTYLTFVITLLIALLRALAEVHYLSDVFIGYVLGASIMSAVFALIDAKKSKTDILRLIDKYIGMPICFVLTVLRKIWRYCFPRQTTSYHDDDIRKILWINFAELGAIVLTHSSIAIARERYPHAEIYFLSFPQAKATLEMMGFDATKQIIINPNGMLSLFWTTIKAIWTARRLGIDTSINTEVFIRFSTIVAYLIGSKRRVGFHPKNISGMYVGDLITHPVLFSTQLHACEAYTSLVVALRFQKTADRQKENNWLKQHISKKNRRLLKLNPSDEECNKLKQKIKDTAIALSIENPRYVILNANASDLVPLRKWPEENYVEIGTSLLKMDKKIVIVLTGSHEEQESSQRLEKILKTDRVVNLAGKTTFSELIALYHISSLLITNDSGPAHFASTTSIKTLVLFGPETPILFGPVGEHQEAISLFLACSPCISPYNAKSSPCRDAVCMKEISTKFVLSRASALLQTSD